MRLSNGFRDLNELKRRGSLWQSCSDQEGNLVTDYSYKLGIFSLVYFTNEIKRHLFLTSQVQFSLWVELVNITISQRKALTATFIVTVNLQSFLNKIKVGDKSECPKYPTKPQKINSHLILTFLINICTLLFNYCSKSDLQFFNC